MFTELQGCTAKIYKLVNSQSVLLYFTFKYITILQERKRYEKKHSGADKISESCLDRVYNKNQTTVFAGNNTIEHIYNCSPTST